MGQKQQPERIATKGTSAFGRLTPLYFYPPPIDHICMTIKQVRTLTPQPNKLSTTQPPRLWTSIKSLPMLVTGGAINLTLTLTLTLVTVGVMLKAHTRMSKQLRSRQQTWRKIWLTWQVGLFLSLSLSLSLSYSLSKLSTLFMSLHYYGVSPSHVTSCHLINLSYLISSKLSVKISRTGTSFKSVKILKD